MPTAGFAVVETARGGVAGVVQGGTVRFRGIPYAASPVRELRRAVSGMPRPLWAENRGALRARGPTSLRSLMSCPGIGAAIGHGLVLLSARGRGSSDSQVR